MVTLLPELEKNHNQTNPKQTERRKAEFTSCQTNVYEVLKPFVRPPIFVSRKLCAQWGQNASTEQAILKASWCMYRNSLCTCK